MTQPVKKKISATKIILLVLLGFFLMGGCGIAACTAAVGGTVAAVDNASKSIAASQSAAKEEAVGLNTSVTSGKMQAVVTKWAKVGKTYGPEFDIQTAQGEFWVASLTVTNVGNEKFTFDTAAVSAYTSTDVKYTASTVMDSSFLTPINPGNSLKVKVAFDVPQGTTITQLGLDEPWSFTSDEVYVKVA